MKRQRGPSAAMIRVICVMALIMLGFAHKPAFSELRNADLAIYVLPDGTTSSICAPSHDQDPSGHRIDKSCEACRLVNAVLLPEPPAVAFRAAPLAKIAATWRETLVTRLFRPPGSGPRAPPLA